MKRRIIALLLAVVLAAALLVVPTNAAPLVMFMAVDDTLLPLREHTMPMYTGTQLYVHTSIFQSAGVTISTSVSSDTFYASYGKKWLMFFVSSGEATDQDGVSHTFAAIERSNRQYYLPIEDICSFFGLSYVVLPNDPVSVIRLKTDNVVFNDKTFLGHYKGEMQKMYESYQALTSISQSPPPRESDAPQITYSDVSIFLSFYAPSAGYAPQLLEQLRAQDVGAVFYLTANEIIRDPELVRRISGEGHMLGIWLETADEMEYTHAQGLLFEAAFEVAMFVSSPADSRTEVRELSERLGAIYMTPTTLATDNQTSAAIIRAFPTSANSRAELRFACSENTSRILPAILASLRDAEYRLRRATETRH